MKQHTRKVMEKTESGKKKGLKIRQTRRERAKHMKIHYSVNTHW